MSIEINFEALSELSIADLKALSNSFKDQLQLMIKMDNENYYTKEFDNMQESKYAVDKEVEQRLKNIFIY